MKKTTKKQPTKRGYYGGGAHRLDPTRVQTSLENQRRHQDKVASIDEELENARQNINWERRKDAETDVVKWVKVYCVGVFLDEPPPPKGEEILREMACAIIDSRPYMILQSRGSGKTSYLESVVMYALSTGKRKFPVIISQNARSAQNILTDIFRIITDTGTAYAQDYPDVCLPFQLCNGSYRRRQMYNGVATEISKTASQLVLARLKGADGVEAPTSGSIIATRGITSGIRGLKHHSLRPDVACLDDIQDDESASSPEQVEKLLSVIYKSVFNIGGKGKIAILQTATPICQDDMVERLMGDSTWKVTKFPAIIKWPDDITKDPDKGLWSQFFKIYDEENAVDSNHERSLKFYKRHRRKMDKGAVVLNPNRFKESDGHVSALQALLEKRHQIGDAAFWSEYQMEPKRISSPLEITPKTVVSRINANVEENVVPDGFVFTCGAIDLNTSYAATLSIMSFKPDSTSVVLCHRIYRVNVDQKLTPVLYNQAVYDNLTRIGNDIRGFGLKVDALGVDAGGRNWDAVCTWCKNSFSLNGIPACAMAGRASTNFNPLARNRLRNAVGRTVLCCNDMEAIKQGSGQKWLFFDSDHFKEAVQRSFIAEVGSPGGCTLYNGLQSEHVDFATQVCMERLKWKKTQADGRSVYSWSSKDPHDYLDTCAMCRAIAENQGLSRTLVEPVSNVRRRLKMKRRVRIV